MADRPGLLLPRQLRDLPADLAAIVVLVVLTNLSVFLPVVKETPLRIVFGLGFVLFLPGYAFIAALFPEEGDGPAAAEGDADGDPGERSRRDRGIDGIERVALSFGLSIAIVPLIGLVLNFTPWGIRLVPIVVAVSGFTLLSTAIAARRRWRLPPEERLAVPYREWLAAGRAELLEPETRLDGALNVLLVASILLAVGSVGYAVAVPKPGERFTEFYLLTENETGDLVAADYPTEFRQGQSEPVIVGVTNQEHRRQNYSIVVVLQNVTITGANNTTVRVDREAELDRLRTEPLTHNETWMTNYSITPTMTGDELRLAFLLYRGTPPGTPTLNNSYRELHLWINVSETR